MAEVVSGPAREALTELVAAMRTHNVVQVDDAMKRADLVLALPECMCLPGPSPKGPVGVERIVSPICPIHSPGDSGGPRDAALRPAYGFAGDQIRDLAEREEAALRAELGRAPAGGPTPEDGRTTDG